MSQSPQLRPSRRGSRAGDLGRDGGRDGGEEVAPQGQHRRQRVPHGGELGDEEDGIEGWRGKNHGTCIFVAKIKKVLCLFCKYKNMHLFRNQLSKKVELPDLFRAHFAEKQMHKSVIFAVWEHMV